MIAATFAILPHLLAAQIMIQNALLAQYYTSLHNYAEDVGFPSPPPPMDKVVEAWSADFKPIQQQTEAITCIAKGKAVHQPMSMGDESSKKPGSGLTIRNGFMPRRVSSSSVIPTAATPSPDPRPMRIPSQTMLSVGHHDRSPSPAPSHQSSYSAHSAGGSDYFQGVAQKKKPPPPPPKRIGSMSLFAEAQYTFDGQNPGDLSFKEGDRIRVIKKTDSTDDWWEGELRGVKGSFPANYCKLV
jgi:amphiphysin